MSRVIDAKLLEVIISCYSDFTGSDIEVRFNDTLGKLELEAKCSIETVEEWNELAWKVKFFNQPDIFYTHDMAYISDKEFANE